MMRILWLKNDILIFDKNINELDKIINENSYI